MSSTHPSDHDLNARLSRQAAQFDRLGGAELDVSQVLARAGEIKRGRRMRATMLMAACVLAIAVPTALVALDRGDKGPSPAPPPSQADTSPISLAGLKSGAEPRTGWAQGKVWHGPKGSEYEWSGARVTAVAPLGDALLVATADPQGQRASLVPPVSDTAQPVTSWPMDGGFAVSEGGKVVAFVEPDGTPVAVQVGSDGRPTAYKLPRIQRGTAFTAVAVTGEDCGPRAATASCSVWVNSQGASPETWTSVVHGIAQRARAEFHTVTDLVNGDLVAGIVDVREDLTTCSAVERFDSKAALWTTCDHRLLTFSPHGDRILAGASASDGIGDTQLAVLDATTGKVELDLRTADQVFTGQMVWEDDSHVLATVFQGGRWAILRVGLDGRREYAVAPVQAEDLDSPFVLASR